LIDNDQGEVAVVIEMDEKGGFNFVSYAKPEQDVFSQEELRNLYLLENLNKNEQIKPEDRPVLVNYLSKYYSEVNQKSGGVQTVENMINVVYNHDNSAAPKTDQDSCIETRETLQKEKNSLIKYIVEISCGQKSESCYTIL
jgi:hypothetical protein